MISHRMNLNDKFDLTITDLKNCCLFAFFPRVAENKVSGERKVEQSKIKRKLDKVLTNSSERDKVTSTKFDSRRSIYILASHLQCRFTA